jgi:hypothetical protein
MKSRFLGIIIVALLAGVCGKAGDADDAPAANPDLTTAEAFVDAFYSFDPARLSSLLSSANESAPRILAYQAWAEGGHYEVLERMPCEPIEEGVIRCSITVRDDHIAALDLGWWVTDSFDLTFREGEIVSVTTSSNDPQVYLDAETWVQEKRPDLVAEPCSRDPETGIRLTPGRCAVAMRQGYLEFRESDEFPDDLPARPQD